jgi:hypothetical protein
MRRTLATGLVAAAYAVFGGVILAAYDEFGNQSLLDLTPLVVADPTPLKLLPGEEVQDRTALPGRAGSDRSSATALARGEHLAPPRRQPGSAMAPSLDTGHGSKADTLVLTERPAMAPPDAESPPAIGAFGAEEPVAAALETPAMAREDTEPALAMSAPGAEEPVAAALEAPSLNLRAAAPLGSATPAFSEEVPQLRPATTRPPAPAFKPLDAVATVVAQALPPPQLGSNTQTSRLGDSPPVPSMKPIVMPSEQRPGRLASRTRAGWPRRGRLCRTPCGRSGPI